MNTTPTVHPIEAESYRILAGRVDLSSFGALAGQVVARVVHATADIDFATSMVVAESAAVAGVAALRSGAVVVCDVEMVRCAVPRLSLQCALDEHDVAPGESRHSTRAAAGMRAAALRHPIGAVFVVGCAPTALFELLDLTASGRVEPALVIGVPVGFVGAAAAKEALRSSGLAAITNVGEKGGSAVAAAALNALVREVGGG